MATGSFKIKKSLNLDTNNSGSVVSAEGDMAYNSTSHKLEVKDNSATRSMVSEDGTASLTNKTFDVDASGNVLSNVADANIKAAAGIVDTKLATISTAGKVSNSATTATSANTASAIVARDVSNNFSAGTITAALTGTASGNLTATANNHGILVSGAANAATVVAPNASTALPLISGGSSADPTWAALTEAGGGTNQTTYTKGDVLYASAANTLSKLGVGTANQVIKQVNGVPAWAAAPSGGVNYISSNPDAEVDTTGWTAYNDTQTFTVTLASPGVFTCTSTTNFAVGQPIVFTTTGALPTGLTAGTTYYISSVLSSTTFKVSATQGGADVNTSVSQSGVHTLRLFVPSTGTGASPNITWTRGTSSPLRGVGQFIFTKDANDRLGEGVGYAFTLDAADKAKPLCISFDYTVGSGTYADGDLQVYLIDVTGSNAIIQPAPYKVLSVTAGVSQKWIGYFQTSASSTSYKLVVHCSSTSASAYTVNFDNFNVGPTYQSYGAVEGDWFAPTAKYVPFATGYGTVTNSSWQVKRVGDTEFVRGYFTAGTCTANSAKIAVRSGITIDTTKTVIAGNKTRVGTWNRVTASGSSTGISVINDSGAVFIKDSDSGNVFLSGNTASSSMTDDNANTILANTDSIAIEFSIPVTGWSSNVQVSSDADTRVVALAVTGDPTNIPGTDAIQNFPTIVNDTHGAYNTNGTYTVPVPGWYEIDAFTSVTGSTVTSGQSTFVQLWKNGVGQSVYGFVRAQASAPGSLALSLNTTQKFNAGDLITLRATTNFSGVFTYGGSGFQGHLEIKRVSGPAQIAASESVNCRYTNTAGSTLTKSANNTVPYATKDYDTHSAFVTDTFTAPMAGKYAVKVNLHIAAGSTWAIGDYVEMDILKDGASHTTQLTSIYGANSGTVPASVSGTVNCVQGTTIKVQCFPSKASASNVTLSTTAGFNSVSIERIGN